MAQGLPDDDVYQRLNLALLATSSLLALCQ
jgi:hypothetical protein